MGFLFNIKKNTDRILYSLDTKTKKLFQLSVTLLTFTFFNVYYAIYESKPKYA